MNSVTAQPAMTRSVIAAFLASGGLNAGTPSEIASIPVSAVHPFAKARRTRKIESEAVSAGMMIAEVESIGTIWPVMAL